MDNPKILIVEYDDAVREAIVEYLKECSPYPFVAVASGAAALLALHEDPAISMVTVCLGQSGIGFLMPVVVKQQYPQTKVILFTGASRADIEADSRSAAFDAIAYKPRIEDLLTEINALAAAAFISVSE